MKQLPEFRNGNVPAVLVDAARHCLPVAAGLGTWLHWTEGTSEAAVGNVELIHKLESLPSAQRAAVTQLVEALFAERHHDVDRLDAALAGARGSWPCRMGADEIDAEVEAMRGEWDDRR